MSQKGITKLPDEAETEHLENAGTTVQSETKLSVQEIKPPEFESTEKSQTSESDQLATEEVKIADNEDVLEGEGLNDLHLLSSEYFLKKQTDSFKCFVQVEFSSSSLYFVLSFFPPPGDPGIDEAFNYVDPDDVVDDIGVEKYTKTCKELGIVAISRITKHISTDELNLKYYGLTIKQMRGLANALKINSHVRILNLQDNWMSPEAMGYISDILRENNTIRILNLQECRIGEQGAKKLCEGLASSQFLEELDLSYNSLGDKGLQALQNCLTENATIKKLNVSHNELTEDSGITLERILLENKSIEELNLEWNAFCTGPGNKRLCNGLSKNEQIWWLNLAWNGIGTRQSMLPITKYVKKAEFLKFLDLSWNRITKEALRMIKVALTKNVSLEKAKLGYNIYTPEEAYYLATALLSKKNNLKELDMENMCVDKDFLKLLPKLYALGRKVKHGRVLSNYKIYGPNINKLLFERCKYLAMKPKKKKMKKDFGHFVLSLPDEAIPKSDFLTFLKKKKVKKIDADLLKELCAKFATKSLKVDCRLMKNAYMSLYPDTVLPEEKKKGKGKKKKKKKGKKAA